MIYSTIPRSAAKDQELSPLSRLWSPMHLKGYPSLDLRDKSNFNGQVLPHPVKYCDTQPWLPRNQPHEDRQLSILHPLALFWPTPYALQDLQVFNGHAAVHVLRLLNGTKTGWGFLRYVRRQDSLHKWKWVKGLHRHLWTFMITVFGILEVELDDFIWVAMLKGVISKPASKVQRATT